MGIDIIKEGDRDKKGNMSCPNCGEIVFVDNYWGDPLKCSCGSLYKPTPRPPDYS